MNEDIKCPVCLNANGGRCLPIPSGRLAKYECDVCGTFKVSGSVDLGKLSRVQRASLSHQIRIAIEEGTPAKITTDWLERFKTESRLPSPALQAANLIRVMGEFVSERGESYPIMESTIAIVGACDVDAFERLLNELVDKGLIQLTGDERGRLPPYPRAHEVYDRLYDLTLDDWERYEAERRGLFAGPYGFIAMKWQDKILDPFVRDVVKPAVKKGLGYDLVDMRDASRAGVIDNIMRTQIRDAAFVLVDLTHDNSGAYWEAGYAEGLGKPVIYICKKDKFDDAKTHFDTNHCTTVPWSLDDKETFRRELIATLRRSLNLFPE